MPWQYLKDFLEGMEVKVARPKNRGGNTVFEDTAPVFMTAPQEVSLKRQGKVDLGETSQMRTRIKYLTLHVEIPEHKRQESLKPCGHCTAKLYLEGRQVLDAPAAAHLALAALPLPVLPPPGASGQQQKRRRTAADCLKELTDLKGLLDQGLLTPEEFQDLKARLLSGD